MPRRVNGETINQPDLFNYKASDVKGKPYTDVTMLKNFMFAGKAKITIKSLKTGNHFTYKIKKIPDTDLWSVHQRRGDDHYRYLGAIFPDGTFKATKKTPEYLRKAEPFIGFQWFYRRINVDNTMPPWIEVYHSGRCGMCGLELTDPVSVAEGYGPDCRKKRLRRTTNIDTVVP